MEVLPESGGEGVALVRINRPEARNALNGAVREQLAKIFVELAGNDEILCVVLTGTEKEFAAGADIKAMADSQPVGMMLRERAELGSHQGFSQAPDRCGEWIRAGRRMRACHACRHDHRRCECQIRAA